MGNRDINKMRIVEEVGRAGLGEEEDDDDDKLSVHHGVYWLKNTGRVGDPTMGSLPFETAVERLQWILSHTMGSPRAFQHRKWELQVERATARQYVDKNTNNNVSDRDVLQSYRQSCDPVVGEMSRYLQAACLVVRLGDVVFVHGALPFTSDNLLWDSNSSDINSSLWDDLTFAMPWLKPDVTARDVGVATIDDWMNALNAFARERVESWVSCHGQSDIMWSWEGGYHYSHTIPSYGQLMQYGMGSIGPNKVHKNPTVVYNRWGVAGNPRKFFRYDAESKQDRSFVRHTKEFFQRTGVRLICCGHHPTGEMPLHIRIDDHDNKRTSWILSGDTSYTGDTIWLNLHSDSRTRQNSGRGDSKSGRGLVAVSEVLIELCVTSGAILDVYSHGIFSDGTKYKSQSLEFDNATTVGPDTLAVGTVASGKSVPSTSESPHGGEWWTQAALVDGSILLAAGAGFKFWTRFVGKR